MKWTGNWFIGDEAPVVVTCDNYTNVTVGKRQEFLNNTERAALHSPLAGRRQESETVARSNTRNK